MSTISKLSTVLMSACFALGTVAMTFDFADARGGHGGGGGGSHHGGGGGGGHHDGGDNHHHHHNDDHHHHHDHWDDWDYWGGYAAGAVAAAAIGSIVYSLPRAAAGSLSPAASPTGNAAVSVTGPNTAVRTSPTLS